MVGAAISSRLPSRRFFGALSSRHPHTDVGIPLHRARKGVPNFGSKADFFYCQQSNAESGVKRGLIRGVQICGAFLILKAYLKWKSNKESNEQAAVLAEFLTKSGRWDTDTVVVVDVGCGEHAHLTQQLTASCGTVRDKKFKIFNFDAGPIHGLAGGAESQNAVSCHPKTNVVRDGFPPDACLESDSVDVVVLSKLIGNAVIQNRDPASETDCWSTITNGPGLFSLVDLLRGSPSKATKHRLRSAVARLLPEVSRVLRPGGWVIIVDRKETFRVILSGDDEDSSGDDEKREFSNSCGRSAMIDQVRYDPESLFAACSLGPAEKSVTDRLKKSGTEWPWLQWEVLKKD